MADIITVSTKGQIAIPQKIREELNLQPGTKLRLTVRGYDIVLSKGDGWRSLGGILKDMPGPDLNEMRREERKHELKREAREFDNNQGA